MKTINLVSAAYIYLQRKRVLQLCFCTASVCTMCQDVVLNNPDTVYKLKQLLQRVPLNAVEVNEATNLISQVSPLQLEQMGLGVPPRPTNNIIPKNVPIHQRLKRVQNILNQLNYNYHPGFFYNVNKRRPFARIMDTARDILRDGLPIKCLDGVFVAIFLTCGWEDLDRFPLTFKTVAMGSVFRHIVLAVRHRPSNKWGALGLSRKKTLMNKELEFAALSDLLGDFKNNYSEWGHQIVKVRIGLPLEHNVYFNGSVCWRFCNVSSAKYSWGRVGQILDDYAMYAKRLQEKYRATGSIAECRQLCKKLTGSTDSSSASGDDGTNENRAIQNSITNN
eukprot:TRINITY_DN10468_c1_g2_i4.p1 TRINITY_DN10468_c1_g2~~TRINITY_DN10468_c1_g2_i4.p1  ORF type:complete len:391 (-),score=26.14 TRINITY_DN10468_c1_g2_i4:742-1746(-)